MSNDTKPIDNFNDWFEEKPFTDPTLIYDPKIGDWYTKPKEKKSPVIIDKKITVQRFTPKTNIAIPNIKKQSAKKQKFFENDLCYTYYNIGDEEYYKEDEKDEEDDECKKYIHNAVKNTKVKMK